MKLPPYLFLRIQTGRISLPDFPLALDGDEDAGSGWS